MNDTTTQEHARNALDAFSALIEAAPESNDTQTATASSETAFTVQERHGWGKKYCETIQLRGEQWLVAFESAKPVVATGGILAMVGDRGPGKTQMAAELARTGKWPEDKTEFARGDGGPRAHRSRTATYCRAIDLFLDLRHAAKNHVQSSEKEVLTKLADVGLLVIDEFQERGESEWENRIVNNLIDKRYASGRPTIIIANLTRKDLFATLGNSIVDRARENGKSIEFNWPSYRSQP